MKLIQTALSGLNILEPLVHTDQRGFFMETFHAKTLSNLGINHTWVQDNHSKSVKGVLRGLHWQIGKPQAKLVRVIAGKILDVAVDIRQASPSFGQWEAVELSAENKKIILIPEGFAHGFLTLTETAEIVYKCSEYYTPQAERGFIWNDPRIAIQWPLQGLSPIISERDSGWPSFKDISKENLF